MQNYYIKETCFKVKYVKIVSYLIYIDFLTMI
ncbi:hypothetical protein CoNPh17_CDS0130 [Staphylococcus phage S-CoN_Ph17]|nr:hypothetical protein CoNPh17_CDS0130 [Staphylococcus phage S-CoN_Ph17]